MNARRDAETSMLLAGLKVLVVDDSANMRDLIVALLNSMGITDITCAEDGDAGLEYFATATPDLVITDGMMEPMTGYAMTSAIRALSDDGASGEFKRSDVPVLMLSGHSEPDIVEWARDEGVTDYIVKPVSPELFYERVLAAISNPTHIVETAGFRGPSPRRTLPVHEAYRAQDKPAHDA
tara:strand:- start:1212 stop:1751 length:540 start_codon:yes stop_codon:yes gene_type:complete